MRSISIIGNERVQKNNLARILSKKLNLNILNIRGHQENVLLELGHALADGPSLLTNLGEPCIIPDMHYLEEYEHFGNPFLIYLMDDNLEDICDVYEERELKNFSSLYQSVCILDHKRLIEKANVVVTRGWDTLVKALAEPVRTNKVYVENRQNGSGSTHTLIQGTNYLWIKEFTFPYLYEIDREEVKVEITGDTETVNVLELPDQFFKHRVNQIHCKHQQSFA